LVDSESAE